MKTLLVLMMFTCAALTCAGDESFVNLGPQITSSAIQGCAFTKMPDGKAVACVVMRGQPAKLVVFDLKTGEMLHRLPLDGADGGWNACTATDGSVYVGTDSNGHLYRWIPGEETAHDLGQVLPEQKWVWDVCPGQNGEVFGGTYPGANVFRYHPKDGFRDIGKGAVAKNENYVRAVAYDAATGHVFAGVGSHAHLIEIDPKNGDKRDILPSEYHEKEFVYGVDILGDHLYAMLSHGQTSLVMNLRKGNEVEAILPVVTGQQIMIRDPEGGCIYYSAMPKVMRFDPSKPKEGPKEVASPGPVIGFTWQDKTLVAFGSYGGVTRINPATGKTSTTTFKLPKEPTPINQIELGPDGKIWVGGYLSGGAASFDPATKKSEQFGGIAQPEDICVVGQSIYFGLYPGARLSVYDTTRPWNPKENNPHQFGDLGPEQQSRPMAMLGVEELKKVYIGTVPEYGLLGGVLATYDIEQDALKTFHDVVHDQSIVSLVYSNGLVIGGTSISGGLGIEPSQKEAKLFIWDPKKNEKILEMTPVESVTAITGLCIGPDKNVWGLANGTLFIFDVAKHQVISRHELFHGEYHKEHIWRDAQFVVHPSGQIYGTASTQFFRLDPKTKEMTTLRKDVGLCAMDRDGRLYFRDRTNLWQYTP
jgi:sugar lactone lactonase YvrE